MYTLLVGYGKIGQIKARIWRSLGREVHVYDPDEQKSQLAISDGFQSFDPGFAYGDDCIVDISTPAAYHLESLKWALDALDVEPQRILMEKPLASGPIELNAFVDLAADPDFSSISDSIVINESYYLSTALEYVMQQINDQAQTIESMRMELSKDRLADVAQGRFVDQYLGTLGIELPHMIAMAQRLGVDLAELSINDVTVFADDTLPHNEGFRLRLSHHGVPVIMESYLGDFRVLDSGERGPNRGVTRTLEVVTTTTIYNVEFDPIVGEKRYMARVRISDRHGELLDSVLLADNHLARNLAKMHTKTYDSVLDPLLSLGNAIEITTYLFDLHSKAHSVSAPELARLVVRSEA